MNEDEEDEGEELFFVKSLSEGSARSSRCNPSDMSSFAVSALARAFVGTERSSAGIGVNSTVQNKRRMIVLEEGLNAQLWIS